MASSSRKEYWVYHERQESLLCGQHALNNLVQGNEFTADSLAEIASQLDQMELVYMRQNEDGNVESKDYLNRLAEGSGNVDEYGNFSIEVLRSALMTRYGLELPNIRQEGVHDKIDTTDMEGFICNRSSHWFAIRKINGKFWNLNSTIERPELISHFKLAAEMEGLQSAGYSVFCVIENLPPPRTHEDLMDERLPQFWWKESDLLQGTTSTTSKNEDPWKDVGSGRRLDGKPKAESRINANFNESRSIYELSEDEQIQAAIQASMQVDDYKLTALDSSNEDFSSVNIGEEPSSGARVQIRLPDGQKIVRRFNVEDPLTVIYAFVAQSNAEALAGKSFSLKAKFPPQDLLPSINESISSVGLAGAAITMSWK